MADANFTVADFFRLGNEAAAHESALRIKEAEAMADIRIKLAQRDVEDSPAGDRAERE